MPPWEKYAATEAATKPKGPWDRYAGAQEVAQPQNQPGLLSRAAGWAGTQLDRIPAGVRGYVEAIQTGDAYNAPNRAWQGIKDPSSVQTSTEMAARAGASTVPTERNYRIYGTGGPMRLPVGAGQYLASDAEGYGKIIDFALPTGLEIIPGAKAAVGIAKKATQAGSKFGAKTLTNAAEKSILEKYSMAQARKYAPTLGVGREISLVDDAQNVISDAQKIMADKLREHDLLYNPGKANFKLNQDLKTYGAQIGDVVQEMKARDVSVNLRKVLDDYAGERVKAVAASGKGVGSIDDFQTKVMPKLQAMIDNLGHDGAGNVPIDKAVAFRQELQDMVKNWGQEAGGPLVQRVAKELQYRANKAIAASDRVGGPKLAALNEKFADLKGLQPLIEDAYSRGFGRAAVGRDTRPLPFTREGIVNRLYETAGSPVKSAMNAKPALADKWANRGRVPSQGVEFQVPPPQVNPEDLAAIKAPLLPQQPEGLAPRVPTQRRPLTQSGPTYTTIRNDAAPGLPPRRPSNIGYAPPPRRSLSPDMDVTELGKVVAAEAAKEGEKYGTRLERVRMIWSMAQEAKSEKERSALMKLLRATQNAKE